MKISVLTNNIPGNGFKAEHGFSLYIEVKRRRILFDTGSTDIYLSNAQKLGLDIQKNIDTVVLSHGHWDHGNGLRFIENKTVITHPGAFVKRYHRNEKNNLGICFSGEELKQKHHVITSAEPHRISDDIIYLGYIPRLNDFESLTTPFVDDAGNPDFVDDDSALVIVKNKALIVISGCAHSGICNTISYAMHITGIRKIHAVIGGFHLKLDNRQTHETINCMKQLAIERIYPAHCTSVLVQQMFFSELGGNEVRAGMSLDV